MADIKAGTTGIADVWLSTAPDDCYACYAAGTCGLDLDNIPAPGWDVSYENETVTVPPETAPGSYLMTVRAKTTSINNCPGGGSAPCKHLAFNVLPPDSPPSGPGPQCPSC